MTTREFLVALDCDDTLFRHNYPDAPPPGDELGCIPWLKAAKAANPGVRFILFSMRHTSSPGRAGDTLTPVADWLRGHGVEVAGMNTCPGQSEWTDSPKAYFHAIVDDRCLGIARDADGAVDWSAVGPQLVAAALRACK